METGHKNHKAVQGENLVCYPLLICPAPFWNPENDAWQQGLVVTGAKQLPKLFTWKLCQHSIRSVIRMMQRYFPCHLQVTLLNVQPLLHLCKMDSPHTGNRPLSYKALGQVFLFVSPGVVIIQKPKQIGAGKASVVHSSMGQIPPHLEKLSESTFKDCSLALSAKSRKPSNWNCSKRWAEIQKTFRKLTSAQSSLGNYRLNPVSRVHMKIILPQRMALD